MRNVNAECQCGMRNAGFQCGIRDSNAHCGMPYAIGTAFHIPNSTFCILHSAFRIMNPYPAFRIDIPHSHPAFSSSFHSTPCNLRSLCK